MKRNEDSLRDLWDNIKHNNICIIGVPEGEEREKGPKDRKSTRLNSSHITISYAVFCLKKKNRKRIFLNEDSLRDLWNSIKYANICIIGVLEGEEREKGWEKIFEEIIVKNIPNVGKEIATQVQEVQRAPGRINPKRNTPRHIVIKLTKIKDKEKLLKATREKRQIT